MKNRFKILTGTALQVEEQLNALMDNNNFVRVISNSGTAENLCVVAYVKPNKEEQNAQS